jgi:Fe2+ or Zn2+ uptake regulation protein
MKRQRATRQLAVIYDALIATPDHPTAEQLFQRVRGVLPRVSLGTVYRNLDKLREQGRLRIVRLEGGQAHYDVVCARSFRLRALRRRGRPSAGGAQSRRRAVARGGL